MSELEKLRVVAEAARKLARSVVPGLVPDLEMVSDAALVELESALDAAGYGMTDEEISRELC